MKKSSELDKRTRSEGEHLLGRLSKSVKIKKKKKTKGGELSLNQGLGGESRSYSILSRFEKKD